MSKFILMVMMGLSLTASAQQSTENGFDKMLYTSENRTLPYRFLKPVNLGEKEKFPLVIFLHGAGERGTDNEAQIKHIKSLFLDQENRRQYPCFVLAPQSPAGMMWAAHDREGPRLVMRRQPTPPMALLIELLQEVEKKFPIDVSRIYITGVSMGGYGTWDMIARFPNRFAAAVPICGGGDTATAPSIAHIPLWAFHGALDKVVVPRHSRVMIKALQDAGGRPGYTEYPDIGHLSWENAYSDPYLLPWMFQQHLPVSLKDK